MAEEFGDAALVASSSLTAGSLVTSPGSASLSAASSFPASAGVVAAIHLSSSISHDIQLSGTLTNDSPDAVAINGAIDFDVTLAGVLTIYSSLPAVSSGPPPPPPPPPLPPPSYIDDGGTIPLLPAGKVLVSVYKPDGVTLIAHVPRRKGVQGLNEMNAAGTGSFQIHIDDPILEQHPDLLDQFNIVKFTIKDKKVKAWVIEDVSPTRVSSGEIADRFATVSGRGNLAVLEAAVVYPEYGLRQNAPEARQFTFAAKDGPWKVDSEWVTPAATKWSDDTTARHTFPTGWPDPDAYWLWSTSPTADAEAGRNWFRGEFTLNERVSALMYFSADNFGTAYIDGVAVISTSTTDWAFKDLNSYAVTLEPGMHTVAAYADNFDVGTFNPAGIIITIMQANAVGDPTTTNIFRSSTTSMTVRGYGEAPGWHAFNVLQQAIYEAQERNVEAVLPIEFSALDDIDSNGDAWTDRQDRTVNVGTTDLLDLATQLIEVAFDLELNPDFVLNAWVRRGLDYSADIRLLPGRDVTNAVATIRGGRLKNQALLKSGSGWVELSSPSSKEEFGRRETGLSVGNAESVDQLVNVGSAAIQEVARPETTIPLSYTSVRGPQPFEDFDLGDVISVPDKFNGMIPARLMSIAFSEEESSIKWDLDFYPHDSTDVIDVVKVGGGENGEPDALYQSEVMSDSPWGFWRLQETTGTKLTDLSGNARHLTIVGTAATLNQTGPVNKSITWATGAYSSGYATAGASKTFQQGIASLECWINIPAIPAYHTTFLGMAVGGINGSSHDKELSINTDGKVAWYVSSGGPHFCVSPDALALNTWYHVVGTIGPDAGQVLYINGVAVATNAGVTTSYAAQPEQVLLRGGGNTFNGHQPCKTAEPAVYFLELTDSRVASHYNALTLGTPP